jgi:hypothetical protein
MTYPFHGDYSPGKLIVQTTYIALRIHTVQLGEKETLEELFAEIDADMVRKQLLEAQRNPEKIPAKIKQIIATPKFPEIITNIFRNVAKTYYGFSRRFAVSKTWLY